MNNVAPILSIAQGDVTNAKTWEVEYFPQLRGCIRLTALLLLLCCSFSKASAQNCREATMQQTEWASAIAPAVTSVNHEEVVAMTRGPSDQYQRKRCRLNDP